MGHSEIFRIQLQLCFRHTEVDVVECILFSKIVFGRYGLPLNIWRAYRII